MLDTVWKIVIGASASDITTANSDVITNTYKGDILSFVIAALADVKGDYSVGYVAPYVDSEATDRAYGLEVKSSSWFSPVTDSDIVALVASLSDSLKSALGVDVTAFSGQEK